MFSRNYLYLIIKEHKIDKYLYLAREVKKIEEHGGDGNTIYMWHVWNRTQRFGKWTRRIRNQRKNRNHSKRPFNQNTEKSPGDLRRLAVNQILG